MSRPRTLGEAVIARWKSERDIERTRKDAESVDPVGLIGHLREQVAVLKSELDEAVAAGYILAFFGVPPEGRDARQQWDAANAMIERLADVTMTEFLKQERTMMRTWYRVETNGNTLRLQSESEPQFHVEAGWSATEAEAVERQRDSLAADVRAANQQLERAEQRLAVFESRRNGL